MPNNQVQIRRDSETNLNSTTPAVGELAFDTTNKELRGGDGLTSGGIIIPNVHSVRQNKYGYVTAGGTADAITATLSPSITSYVSGLSIKLKATANNTGAATLQLNGISGPKSIKKRSGGTLANLAAGDIINGGVYELIYDGTQFQIMSTEAGAGIISVSQGNLNTSTGTFSTGSIAANSYADVVLPGGQYGFYPTVGRVSGSNFSNEGIVGLMLLPSGSATITETVRICNKNMGSSFSSAPMTGTQRYITSSPPYDLGEGEVGGFLYALVDGNGDIKSHYMADAPPWAYNGPTDIRCQHICPISGDKFRKVMKKRSLDEIMDGAPAEFELQKITQKIKNADMNLIPQPFGNIPDGHTVVLVDPMDDRLARMIGYQNAGGGEDLVKALMSGKIYVDNEPLTRKGPKGIIQAGLRFKYNRS